MQHKTIISAIILFVTATGIIYLNRLDATTKATQAATASPNTTQAPEVAPIRWSNSNGGPKSKATYDKAFYAALTGKTTSTHSDPVGYAHKIAMEVGRTHAARMKDVWGQ